MNRYNMNNEMNIWNSEQIANQINNRVYWIIKKKNSKLQPLYNYNQQLNIEVLRGNYAENVNE